MGKEKIAETKASEKKDAKDASDKSSEKSSSELKIEELTDDLKRVQADFENYKKRCEKENFSFRNFAKADLIKRLLTVLDSFEIALQNTSNHDEFVKGMELVLAQFYSALKDEGLEPIVAKGKKFDPHRHEVLLTTEGDDGLIIDELQKGYTLKGSVLRHSKVKIGKRKDG